jgi:hypothetical protein
MARAALEVADNRRLVSADDNGVAFRWKDYRVVPEARFQRGARALQLTCSSVGPTSASSRRRLGMRKLDATARYTRVATGMISAVESPLDLLSGKSVKRRGRPKPAA